MPRHPNELGPLLLDNDTRDWRTEWREEQQRALMNASSLALSAPPEEPVPLPTAHVVPQRRRWMLAVARWLTRMADR